jgi:hypothetical protein
MTPLLKIAYEEGLYSQGTPDSWDEQALQNYGERIIAEICDLIAANEYRLLPNLMHRMSAYAEICLIKTHFGVDDAAGN